MKTPFIIKKINIALAAKRVGCCWGYRWRILRAKDSGQLLDLYAKGIRFCIKKDCPSIEMLSKYSTREELGGRGIYINENLEGKESRHRTMVALGGCSGHLHYGGFLICRIVAKNDAVLDITVDDHALLMADILDRAKVTFHVKDKARLTIYRYGDAPMPEIDDSECEIKPRITNRTMQYGDNKK